MASVVRLSRIYVGGSPPSTAPGFLFPPLFHIARPRCLFRVPRNRLPPPWMIYQRCLTDLEVLPILYYLAQIRLSIARCIASMSEVVMGRRQHRLLGHRKPMRLVTWKPLPRCCMKDPQSILDGPLRFLLEERFWDKTSAGPRHWRLFLPMVGAPHECFHSMAECELDGHEAGVNNLLEHLYLDSNREYQHDFGPRVHEGPVRRRNTVRQSFIPRDGTARRPEATLIAQLASHTDAVTAFAVSPDHLFFVSSSDDKTVKVWDTARLERNVTSKPRFSYAQHQAKIKAVCMLEGVHCFASAADDGSLHVVRVHVSQGGALPRYTKINTIREHRTSRSGEYITCMTHYDSGAPLCPPPTLYSYFPFQNRHPILCTRQHTRQYAIWIYVPCGFYSLWNTRTTVDPLRLCVWIEDMPG
jgi:hypothetical protein